MIAVNSPARASPLFENDNSVKRGLTGVSGMMDCQLVPRLGR